MIERMERLFEFRTKLRQGALMVGTLISEIRNPNVMYMLAQSGFDFVIVDMEHGAYSPETVSDHIAAARGAGIPVIVRICEIRRETILKPLDSGAVGLLVPQVNTAEQAKEVVAHAKYPPEGNRGVAIRRAHNFYRKVDAAAYMKQTNEQTFIAVQAESPEAIENLEEIADVPGVDSIFVGPFDLSVSMGIPGKIQDLLKSAMRSGPAVQVETVPVKGPCQPGIARKPAGIGHVLKVQSQLCNGRVGSPETLGTAEIRQARVYAHARARGD